MAWSTLVMDMTHNNVLFFTRKCGVPVGIHKSFSLRFK